jgi:membrane-associated phospholipid phosphatase
MQIDTGQALSRIGAPYTLFGVAGGAYIVGRFTRNERLRETGRIGTEALVHSFLITHAIKAITGRRRPEDGNGRGSFFQGRVSFPSGHGMMTWSLASVIAHEYRDHKWIVVGAYASALAVNAGRTMARKHFLSDSLVGSTVGYLLGQYLYKRNRQIANGSATSRIRIPEIIPSYDRSSKQAALSLVWRP